MLSTPRYSSILICVFSFLLAACGYQGEVTKIAGPTMGTQYHISWVDRGFERGEEAVPAAKVQEDIDSTLASINQSMSTYIPDSELSILNRSNNNEWQDISIDFYRVMMMSLMVNRSSNGAFDATIGPLVNLWGFGPKKSIENEAPSQAEIEGLLNQVGSHVIDMRTRDEGFQIKLLESRFIDLSAIAKGYAVDRLAVYLERQGINDYLVEVGGEILAKGQKPDGSSWKIAIEAPNDNGRAVQKIISLDGLAVATSGDYRNFFEQEGVRYSHTLDIRTGRPVTHGLASVSVLHESAALADAWATALTVLGPDEGMKIAQYKGLAAYFIVREEAGYREMASEKFNEFLN